MSTCIRVADRGVVVERVRLVMMALDLVRIDGTVGWNSEGRRNERRRRGGMHSGAIFFPVIRDEVGRWLEDYSYRMQRGRVY